MTAAAMVQMLAILAPIIQSAIVEGGKIIVTYKENVTQEQLNHALELAKSATWPELTFAPAVPQP